MNKFSDQLAGFFRNLSLRVSLQEQILFTRHLAIIIKSGMPLLDALSMLKKQTKKRSMNKILEQVIKDVSNGQFLSASLEKYKSVFGDLFINIIKVGETSGILSENLEYLSQELKKSRELHKKVIGALIYPMVILIATLGVVAAMAIFIFPKIFPVFASLNIKLPATTRLLIASSNFLTQRGGTALVVAAGIIITIWLLLKVEKIRFFYHWSLLKIPLIGGMMTSVNMANFARTFGLLLKSGVKIVEAINITADTLPNLVYKKGLKEVAGNIQKGEAVSKYLLAHPNLFPAMASNMLAVGENTGNLSETLIYLSEFYESDLDELVKNLSTILEPALMVVMGLIVGFVAVSIITPIYSITQNLGH